MTKDKIGKDQLLLEASRTGDANQVERILNHRMKRSGPLASLRRAPGPNGVRDPATGFTCLHHAALNGHVQVVAILLQYGSNVNLVDYKGSSALHLAAWSGNLQIVKLLLTGASAAGNHNQIVEINLINNDHQTPLSLAAQFGHTLVASLLLSCGADPLIRNKRLESPLDLACLYGRLETVIVLLESRTNLLQLDEQSLLDTVTASNGAIHHSPLHYAARNGHRQVVDLLLRHNFNINHVTSHGSALHESIMGAKLDIIKFLLESGIDHATLLDGRQQTCLQLLDNELQNSRLASEIRAIFYNHNSAVKNPNSSRNNPITQTSNNDKPQLQHQHQQKQQQHQQQEQEQQEQQHQQVAQFISETEIERHHDRLGDPDLSQPGSKQLPMTVANSIADATVIHATVRQTSTAAPIMSNHLIGSSATLQTTRRGQKMSVHHHQHHHRANDNNNDIKQLNYGCGTSASISSARFFNGSQTLQQSKLSRSASNLYHSATLSTSSARVIKNNSSNHYLSTLCSDTNEQQTKQAHSALLPPPAYCDHYDGHNEQHQQYDDIGAAMPVERIQHHHHHHQQQHQQHQTDQRQHQLLDYRHKSKTGDYSYPLNWQQQQQQQQQRQQQQQQQQQHGYDNAHLDQPFMQHNHNRHHYQRDDLQSLLTMPPNTSSLVRSYTDCSGDNLMHDKANSGILSSYNGIRQLIDSYDNQQVTINNNLVGQDHHHRPSSRNKKHNVIQQINRHFHVYDHQFYPPRSLVNNAAQQAPNAQYQWTQEQQQQQQLYMMSQQHQDSGHFQLPLHSSCTNTLGSDISRTRKCANYLPANNGARNENVTPADSQQLRHQYDQLMSSNQPQEMINFVGLAQYGTINDDGEPQSQDHYSLESTISEPQLLESHKRHYHQLGPSDIFSDGGACDIDISGRHSMIDYEGAVHRRLEQMSEAKHRKRHSRAHRRRLDSRSPMTAVSLDLNGSEERITVSRRIDNTDEDEGEDEDEDEDDDGHHHHHHHHHHHNDHNDHSVEVDQDDNEENYDGGAHDYDDRLDYNNSGNRDKKHHNSSKHQLRSQSRASLSTWSNQSSGSAASCGNLITVSDHHPGQQFSMASSNRRHLQSLRNSHLQKYHKNNGNRATFIGGNHKLAASNGAVPPAKPPRRSIPNSRSETTTATTKLSSIVLTVANSSSPSPVIYDLPHGTLHQSTSSHNLQHQQQQQHHHQHQQQQHHHTTATLDRRTLRKLRSSLTEPPNIPPPPPPTSTYGYHNSNSDEFQQQQRSGTGNNNSLGVVLTTSSAIGNNNLHHINNVSLAMNHDSQPDSGVCTSNSPASTNQEDELDQQQQRHHQATMISIRDRDSSKINYGHNATQVQSMPDVSPPSPHTALQSIEFAFKPISKSNDIARASKLDHLCASTMTTASLCDNTNRQLDFRPLFEAPIDGRSGGGLHRSTSCIPIINSVDEELRTHLLRSSCDDVTHSEDDEPKRIHDSRYAAKAKKKQTVAKKEATLKVLIDQTEQQDDIFYIDVSELKRMTKRRSRDVETLTDEELCAAIDDSGHIKFTLRRKKVPKQQLTNTNNNNKQTKTSDGMILAANEDTDQKPPTVSTDSFSQAAINFSDAKNKPSTSQLSKCRSSVVLPITTIANMTTTTTDATNHESTSAPSHLSAIARRKSTIMIGNESYSFLDGPPPGKPDQHQETEQHTAKVDGNSQKRDEQVSSTINQFNISGPHSSQADSSTAMLDKSHERESLPNIDNLTVHYPYSKPDELIEMQLPVQLHDQDECEAPTELKHQLKSSTNCCNLNKHQSRRHSTTGLDRIPRNFFKFGVESAIEQVAISTTFHLPALDNQATKGQSVLEKDEVVKVATASTNKSIENNEKARPGQVRAAIEAPETCENTTDVKDIPSKKQALVQFGIMADSQSVNSLSSSSSLTNSNSNNKFRSYDGQQQRQASLQNNGQEQEQEGTDSPGSSNSSSMSKESVKSIIAKLQQQKQHQPTNPSSFTSKIPGSVTQSSRRSAKSKDVDKPVREDMAPLPSAFTHCSDVVSSAGRAKPVAAMRKVNTIIAAKITQSMDETVSSAATGIDKQTINADKENGTSITRTTATTKTTNDNTNYLKGKPKPAPPVKPATLFKQLNLVNNNNLKAFGTNSNNPKK